MTRRVEAGPADTLTISPEKVIFVIEKAREFSAKDVLTDSDPGSNATDDGMAAVLEDHPDDSAVMEMASLIRSLNVDEQIDLVTLMWVGRDSYKAEEWTEVRSQALAAHSSHTARYLAGTPLLADFLADGLDVLGYDVASLEAETF